MDDGKIVDLFLERSEDAITEASAKYGKSLRKIAENILGDSADAEECENDTYARAWELIPPNEPRTYLFAFLSRITRFIAIDRYRERVAEKRQAPTLELSEEIAMCLPDTADTESYIDERELGRIISDFLRSQSAERRGIFMRRYFHMDSVAEIAHRFKISESKVKTTLFRLRNELRARLESEGYSV